MGKRLTEAAVSAVYDKRGIPIEFGDIVKVFHFIGARRKRHYMYKQCLGAAFLHENHTSPYMLFSHLNFIEDRYERDGPYPERLGRQLSHYEIVQSIRGDHEGRHRITPAGRLALEQEGEITAPQTSPPDAAPFPSPTKPQTP